MRRTTMDTNPFLFNKLELDERRLPQMFLVNNTSNGVKQPYEMLDEKTLKKYLKKTDPNLNVEEYDRLLDDGLDEDHIDEALKSASGDARLKFAKILRVLFEMMSVLSSGELERFENDMNAARDHDKKARVHQVKDNLKK